jgi:serine/threonine-protein kinase ATR
MSFERPELVPFRLTKNMADAMGSTGVEGMFRRSCEETLRVLRSNRDSLMGVLETFTNDPLLEWKKARMVGSAQVNSRARCLTPLRPLSFHLDASCGLERLAK